ncbi:NAD(P)/FAD-dependent oxidoreductase [Amycolatopsis sp. GM8]|uniref:flavin-containing monooxygenase n=1 Tax=Amycolatopsis sp. GM8 TaxID=2896530 RepID=UPI001F231EFD|nr:NAD(P)/FAD-dependent oxidoreductase [Amycolatopsis sp. GM8]
MAHEAPYTGLAEDELRAALAAANIPILLLVLAQLTGDHSWLDSPYTPTGARGFDENDSGGLPEDLQHHVRESALQAVLRYYAGDLVPVSLEPIDIARLLSAALAEPVPAEYGPLLAEEFGQTGRDVQIDSPAAPGFRVLIIGLGLAGLCAAIKLKQAGVGFTILEKNPDLGGTWFENTYPGCGVDTPSHLYSYSFDPLVGPTRYFSRQDELRNYLVRVAEKSGVLDDVVFGTEVDQAAYNDDDGTWTVRTTAANGDHTDYVGNVLISAVGVLNRPMKPDLPGLDDFAGPRMHTAEWRSDVEITGRRVGVIGTGASAMQLVPAIAGHAERVLVFQRSKQWAIPHPNCQLPVPHRIRQALEHIPFYARWYRLRALWMFGDRLHSQLQVDPAWEHPDRSINAANEAHRVWLTNYISSELGDREDLVDACVPDYPPYGKRPLIDNGWYRTMRRDDIDLLTAPVERIGPHSVHTADGVEHPVDVLVLATGFRALRFLWPIEITGRAGQKLSEVWGQDDARAYLGMTVPGFPSLFILNGPNTTAGHGGSAVLSIELQVRYVQQAIKVMIEQHRRSLEVRKDVFLDYNAELDAALAKSIWAHPGMTTYYRNPAGRVVVSSPWTYLEYWRRTRELKPDDYLSETADPGLR